jgi:hypothetical protein
VAGPISLYFIPEVPLHGNASRKANSNTVVGG